MRSSSVVAVYAQELRDQAESILAEHPEILHEWRSDGLVFLPIDADGFEINVMPEAHGIIVFTDVGKHEHVDGAPEQAVQDALGLVRDLLSPDMRIRELRAGRQPYRWILERYEAGSWRTESGTGLLLWNYFGRRTERIYQNRHLPGRLNARGQPDAGGLDRDRS